MKIQTKYFGVTTYTKEAGADFDAQKIELNNKVVMCKASIFSGLNEIDLENAIGLLDDLKELDKLAREMILEAYQSGDSVVCEFLDEHFNEYGDEVSKEIYDKLGIDKQDNIKFIENIELGSMYIDSEDGSGVTITLDYNLIWTDLIPFTDQILAVRLNDEKQVLGIYHES